MLPGYEVNVGGLHSSKYLYNVSLHHEGVSPVWMSVNDQTELDNWTTIFEKYSRAEGSIRQKRISSSKLLSNETPKKMLTQKVVSKISTGGKKRGPVKADHNISGVKAANEV